MNNQYAIVYLPFQLRRGREFTREAVTGAEAETCVMQLLSAGARVLAIRCNGVELPARQFDQLLKTAALRCASGLLCVSLALSAKDLRTRFGLAA